MQRPDLSHLENISTVNAAPLRNNGYDDIEEQKIEEPKPDYT
jgi:hypothetical protein